MRFRTMLWAGALTTLCACGPEVPHEDADSEEDTAEAEEAIWSPQPGLYTIHMMGKCLDITNGVISSGSMMEIWDCNDVASQLFKVTAAGELRTIDEKWCVDVQWGSSNNHTPLWLWECNGGDAQRFRFGVGSPGDIRPSYVDRCLTVQNGNTANYTPIEIADCNGSSSQTFTLQKAPSMVQDTNTAFTEVSLTGLTAGTPVTIATTSLSAGADTVLHIVDSVGNEVGWNDDSGTLASSVTFTPVSGKSYKAVVRAYSGTSTGTCTLTKNGTAIKTNLAFRAPVLLDNVRGLEQIDTVRVTRGAGTGQVLYALYGGRIKKRFTGGGVGGGVRFTANQVTGVTFPGQLQVMVGVPSTGTTGAVRVVRNDRGLWLHDGDSDGLGVELEASLGTCDTRTATARKDGLDFACNLAADARDTDGDGLHDDWEVYGINVSAGAQLLPAWGADPRHMDIFYEVDFQQHCVVEQDGAPCVPETGSKLLMSSAAVKSFAAVYADTARTLTAAEAQTHAQDLRNPDGKPGISVHLDTGKNPDPSEPGYSPSDWTLFGDWGGHTMIPWNDPNNHQDGAQGQHFTQSRFGIFRYAYSYWGGGGSAGLGYSCPLPYDGGGAIVGAHECGHANGLDHAGVGTTSLNCAPHYASIMNYAFLQPGYGFVDAGELGPATLNGVAMTETGAGVSPAFASVLQSVFGYYVQGNNVDWNRDGVFAPAGTTVRANVNWRYGVGCESSRGNATELMWSSPATPGFVFPGATDRDESPSIALVRTGGTAFLLQNVGGTVAYKSTSNLNCPKIGASTCTAWSGESKITDQTGIEAFDAIRPPSSSSTLLLVYRIGTNLWQRTLTKSGTSLVGGPATLIASDATNQPALANLGTTTYLAYRSTSGVMRQATRTTGAFSAPVSTTISIDARTSPGLVAANLGGAGTAYALHGVFASPSASVPVGQLYKLSGASWAVQGAPGFWGELHGKPALAWVPPAGEVAGMPSGSLPGGRLYVARTRRWYDPANDKGDISTYLSFTGRASPGAPLGFFDADLDNVWTWGVATALLYEAGVDVSLHAADAHLYTEWWDHKNWIDNGTTVRPAADGIVDLVQTTSSDWPVLRRNVCDQLNARSPDPVACP